ncbi:MAG: hypothetical protein R3C58_09125 [Parvularculaceae bacterium]
MAVVTNPADYAAPSLKVGAKTSAAILYVLMAAVAIAIGVPAAIATATAAGVVECDGGCA